MLHPLLERTRNASGTNFHEEISGIKKPGFSKNPGFRSQEEIDGSGNKPERLDGGGRESYHRACHNILKSRNQLRGNEKMFQSVEGVYRNGKVELSETPPHIESARVIVTFLSESTNLVDMQARGIEPEAAAELRAKLQTFAPEWERPEMEAYDNL